MQKLVSMSVIIVLVLQVLLLYSYFANNIIRILGTATDLIWLSCSFIGIVLGGVYFFFYKPNRFPIVLLPIVSMAIGIYSIGLLVFIKWIGSM